MAVVKQDTLFKVIIDVSKYFGGEEGDFTVTLREPSVTEANPLISIDKDHIDLSIYEKLIPKVIIDSTFEKSEGVKMSNQEVAQLLISSSSAFFEVVEVWSTSIPLAQRKGKN